MNKTISTAASPLALAEDAATPAMKRDAVIVVIATLVAGLLSVGMELSEKLAVLTNAGEHYQLDELPGILLFLALALLWFAQRRGRETHDALQRWRLGQAALASSLEENRRLALQTLAAQESERKHLARELHDEMGQYLNAIKIDAVSLQQAATPAQGQALSAILTNADHVYLVINRMIRRLRPAGLDDLGLPAALESCVDDWRSRLPAIAFDLDIDGAMDDLEEERTLTVYRMVQEGLTNAVRHAAATRITVSVRCSAGAIEVVVLDDGAGRSARGTTATGTTGLGLIGMRERVQALGGELTAERIAGHGFRLAARVPLTAGARA